MIFTFIKQKLSFLILLSYHLFILLQLFFSSRSMEVESLLIVSICQERVEKVGEACQGKQVHEKPWKGEILLWMTNHCCMIEAREMMGPKLYFLNIILAS